MVIILIIILIIVLIVIVYKRKKHPKQKAKPKFKVEINDSFDKDNKQLLTEIAQKSYDIRKKQYEETFEIITSSMNLKTILSRFNYLNSLLKYLENDAKEYPEFDYFDLIYKVRDLLTDKEQYIDMAITRLISKADIDTVGLTHARRRNKYMSVYRQCENVKDRLSEINIKAYTTITQQRLNIDTLSLPDHSALLTRLNCSGKNMSIPAEYYDDEFPTSSAAVKAMIELGYLTTTEDGARYILTESGLKQTGWLQK